MRLPSHLHPPLDELLYKLLSGVHWLVNGVNHERQDEADQQTFAEGDPQHLVLAQTKALSDPLDVGLVPQQEGKGLLRLLRLLGFLCHRSMMAAPGNTTQLSGSTSEQKTQCSQLLREWAPGASKPSEMAGAQHLALTQRHVSEVITGGTASMALEGIQLTVIHKTPLLHQLSVAVRLNYCRSEGIGSESSGSPSAGRCRLVTIITKSLRPLSPGFAFFA